MPSGQHTSNTIQFHVLIIAWIALLLKFIYGCDLREQLTEIIALAPSSEKINTAPNYIILSSCFKKRAQKPF